MEIFPIALPCSEQGHGSYAFRSTFMATKPKDLTWYGYDTIIHNRCEVEFVVYDMLDNFHGGVGKEITRFKALVPDSLTKEPIDRKILHLAFRRREAELIAREGEIVKQYADEIRAEMEQSC